MKNKLHTWILFCFGLLLSRMLFTGTTDFLFLVWNLVLAWFPYHWAKLLFIEIKWQENKIIRLTIMMLWLLFLPNSFYIITDFIHLTYPRNAPFWLDTLIISSFALVGFYWGAYSLYLMEFIIRIHYNPKIARVLLPLVLLLAAYGIYLGRFIRLNSWDVMIQPQTVISEVLHSLTVDTTLYFSLGLGLFLLISYATIKPIFHNQIHFSHATKHL